MTAVRNKLILFAVLNELTILFSKNRNSQMIYVHGIERSLKDSLQFHLVHLILAI